MFDYRHYVPILRGKRGEFDALGWISDLAKDVITPLIELDAQPWDHEDDVPAKSLEAHLDVPAKRLGAGWGPDRPLWLDSLWLEPEAQASGRHHLVYLFDSCRAAGLQAVPVGGLERGSQHTDAVREVANVDGRGAVLRLDSDDLADPTTLVGRVDAWLAAVGLGPDEVDLVLDFGELTRAAYGATTLATRVLLPALPYLHGWRTLTLAAGAFPQNLADVTADSEEFFERFDWKLCDAARASAPPRLPSFGDYAIGHPSLLWANPRHLRPSAHIRYSTAADWLVVKRQWIRRGFDQFQVASTILSGRPEYAGSGHCRGCEFIAACAAGGSTGNLTTWRSVGTAHHLTQTAAAVASLA